MMIPKLLNSRNSRGLRVLCSVVLLGTTVACGETNDPEPEATQSSTGRNQPADNDGTNTRNTTDDDDAPTANAGDDDDDQDLGIDSNEGVDEDLGINGGRTRGGGGGGRSRTNSRDITSDGGVDVDAGDVDAGDVDAGEDVDVDAGVDEVVVDAGDAGVAP
jgi:hypothetical protein